MKIKPSIRKEKDLYIKKMAEMLKVDPRSELKELKYDVVESWDWYEEYITILFTSGSSRKLCVTGNSDYGILMDVTRAVYG